MRRPSRGRDLCTATVVVFECVLSSSLPWFAQWRERPPIDGVRLTDTRYNAGLNDKERRWRVAKTLTITPLDRP